MNNFLKKHWQAITLCIAFSAIAVISYPRQTYLPIMDSKKTPQGAIIAVTESQPTIEDTKKENTKTIVKLNTIPATTPTTTPSSTPNPATSTDSRLAPEPPPIPVTESHTIPITITITSTTYAIDVPEQSNVYDALQILAQEHPIPIEYKNFGADLGYMLQSMNGIPNNPRIKYYWIYYINGVKATIGISNKYLHSSDYITWQYEKDTF